mmetsp:Transcript_25729/g.47012  ORF Transcript_25729/g.47012 Transcript_25729/m.47012 type:complete len:238 (-) Transcript_25729:408-1121(-)
MGGGASSKKPSASVPAVGDVIVLRSYGVIGKVMQVEEPNRKGGKPKVHIVEQGPGGKAEPDKYDCKDWAKVDDVPELKDFAPSLEVTAEFRGAKVNGWIVDCSEKGELTVKFRPDAAHAAVDKTNWALGAREKLTKDKMTAGHTGDAQPRNRTADEIAAEKTRVQGYGVSYVHCCRCGRAVWEDPCDCYVKRSPGYACAQCGKKHTSASAACCGQALSDNAQNQGWLAVLGNQYGHF